MLIDVKNDPRFDTLYKRVIFFRRPDETDEQFTGRLGITTADLNTWRTTGEEPETITFYEALGRRLGVDHLWLAAITSHSVDPFPDGEHRLTSIPRFRPWIQCVDRIDENGARPRFEYCVQANASSSLQ